MSGRRKGDAAQREAADVLRALGLRVVLAKRDGADWGPDVDAFVRTGPTRFLPLQVKREEDARPAKWTAQYVAHGVAVMYRRNREPWAVLVAVPGPYPGPLHVYETVDAETFAALVLGGVL